VERPTISDIAKRAGVSKGAVSFALNGRPGVSEATRQRILAVAEEMHWRPHSAARALGNSRIGAVGLVISRPARSLGVEPFFGELVSGLQIGLSQFDLALQLLIVEDTMAEVAVYRRWAAARRVDGFVVVDLREDDPRIPVLEELGVPTMVIGGPVDSAKLHCSWADDAEAMGNAINYLTALGHQRIVHIAGLPEFRHTQRRMEVVARARDELGIAVESINTDYSNEDGAAITRGLLSRRNRPTAVIYDSDVMAVAGLGVAIEMGVQVPHELSLLSFDDSLLTRLTHPSLTALSRDTQAWTAEAGRRLGAAIAGQPGELVHRSATPVLTVRESTTAPAH
jgi:DNA-binding LacI/PurR family transcriptional regulator